jgi:hypothetical protein
MRWPNIIKRLDREVLDPTRVGVLDGLMNSIRNYKYRNQDYRPIFIAGTTGGGTTVLAMFLRQNVLTAGLVAESALQLPLRSPLRIKPMRSYESIYDYRKAINAPSNYSIINARNDLLTMYRAHTRHHFTNIIDKGPNVNLVRSEFLHQCFPDSLFILLVRDPVACIEGMRRKWPLFGNAPIEKAIDFYEDIHTKFLEVAEKTKLNAVYVGYNQLVRDSDMTLSTICKYGNLQPGVTDSFYEERPNRQGQGVRNVADGKLKIVQDADQKAYARLNHAEINKVKSRLDPLCHTMSESFKQ